MAGRSMKLLFIVASLALSAGLALAQAPKPGVLPGFGEPSTVVATQQASAIAATVFCPHIVVIAAEPVACTMTVAGYRPDQRIVFTVAAATDDPDNRPNELIVRGLPESLDPDTWTGTQTIDFDLLACSSRVGEPNAACTGTNEALMGIERLQVTVAQGSSRAEAILEVGIVPSNPADSQTYRLGSVSHAGKFLLQSDGALSVEEVVGTENAAAWYPMNAPGTDTEPALMFCNVADPMLCLVARDGAVRAEAVAAGDPASYWLGKEGSAQGSYFIHSSVDPNLYLSHDDAGSVILAERDQGGLAQEWLMRP